MAEAMERVRAELGPEAIIVSSRLVAGGIELSAALEDEPRELAPPPLDVREALRYHAVPLGLQAALATGPLPEALARFLRFGALPLGAQDPPLMLAGPPGAGKTSTIARLAVRLVLAGTVPMIVTADGYRAAAAEQLAAFTKLLGVSLVVAHTPRALARAMKRRPEGAPVLIDSTGCDALAAARRSPRSPPPPRPTSAPCSPAASTPARRPSTRPVCRSPARASSSRRSSTSRAGWARSSPPRTPAPCASRMRASAPAPPTA